MAATALFGLVAGLLSTLSPCVLPLLPVVLTTAVSQHRAGPVALAAGLALSFTGIGLFVALVGFSVGLDLALFRMLGGVVLIGLGLVLMVPRAQMQLAAAASPLSGWTESRFGRFEGTGLTGQFLVGVLLGAVWSPCVGPTLGAASILAARGESLGEVTLTMAVFGLGAALPLMLLGLLSREALLRWRARLLGAGKGGKMVLGVLLVAVGLLVVSGVDKRVEAALVAASPEWLTALTTRF
ncbi:cytochrome c biogenesis protein CcdA [Paroceanicella profunda]|uniref:Cytochrome c biogenesis protein CcdA n=1 Tax=Paroceanicella profunda TaxID=2579971 RepID=A0A5B8FII3_9RHOB|nr:cytochrome c biogenesis protein CcdA [Paroceanicella profunda]QDL93098.1 cytochrome c biogenesis protein CcdA [Paroceanicella profunda]